MLKKLKKIISKLTKLIVILSLGSSLTYASEKKIDIIINKNLFKDISSEDIEVLYLAEFGIVKGYPDGTVKTSRKINRAETLTVIARSLELEPDYDSQCSFKDIEENSWYAGYVSAMCQKGLINGYEDGTFKPETQITRAEAIKILLLGLNLDIETDYSHLPNNIYPDNWYAKYADYAIKRNISPIMDEDFQAEKLYTRGDLFTNIYRIKRILELEEEIYNPKFDPKIIEENFPIVESTGEEIDGTPDLILTDITAGGLGFSSVFLDINICNQGQKSTFENLELKINDYSKTLSRITLKKDECYTTGYYSKSDEKIELTEITNNWGENININAEIDPDNKIKELNEKNNKLQKPISIPFCGNKKCETGENYGVCPFDCAAPCESEFCNEKISVYCGCSERDYLLKQCTFNEPCTENACKEQEVLFDEILEAQTKVYDCLTDYFDYKPLRVPYIIYGEKTTVCNFALGCPRPNTSRYTNVQYIVNPSIPGFVEHGEIYVTKPEQLIIDEHEMTHYFLNQMLHSVPQWFHEGVAIQTDARLDCDAKAHPIGSGIGYEKTLEGGKIELESSQEFGIYLNEEGTITLNEKFYKDLKAKKVKINKETTPKLYNSLGEKDPHYLGALFMMGLKLDYNCTEECVSDIIIKLRRFEESRCPGPDCGIAIALGTRAGEEGIKANIIKEKANEVTGKDTSELFELLELE